MQQHLFATDDDPLQAISPMLEMGAYERLWLDAALDQGRMLLIHDSCFRPNVAWPWELAERGGIRVKEVDEIRQRLQSEATIVPIPPSREQGDPLYDDRLLRLLMAADYQC